MERISFVLLALLLLAPCDGGAACCESKAKAAAAAQRRFIVHPDDAKLTAPLVPDASAAPPPTWDVEEDGEWSAPLVPDPTWRKPQPRLVRNPEFVEPKTLPTAVLDDVRAAMPWVLVGAAVTAAFQQAAPTLPARLLTVPADASGAARLGAVFKGAALGVLTPLCSCGVLPVARGFVDAGAALPAVVAFVTASQSAGVDSAAITWGLLGPMAALCRLAAAVCLAVTAGLACGFKHAGGAGAGAGAGVGVGVGVGVVTGSGVGGGIGGGSGAVTPPVRESPRHGAGSAARAVLLFPFRFVAAAADALFEVLPTVVAGIAFTVAVLRQLPALHTLLSRFAGDATLGPTEAAGWQGWQASLAARLLVLGCVLPLQLCEHATVSLAAAVQKSGGSPGLAFGFLLSAPATNLATLLLLVDAGRKRGRGGAARASACCAQPQQGQGGDGGGLGAGGAAVAIAVRVAAALVCTSLALSYAVDGAGLDLLVENEAEAGGSALSLTWLTVDTATRAVVALVLVALLKRAMEAMQGDEKADEVLTKAKSE
eukprot:g1182.t1